MYFPAEGWEMSNRLKVFYDEMETDFTPYINDMNNLLNPEKFLIEVGFIIIDTTKIENIFSAINLPMPTLDYGVRFITPGQIQLQENLLKKIMLIYFLG